MNRGIFSLFRQDIVLTWRTKLVLVTIITLVVIVALYWTLPLIVGDSDPFQQQQIYLDRTEGKVVSKMLAGLSEADVVFADDRESLETFVRDGGLVGIIAAGSADSITYELVYDEAPGASSQNLIKAALRSLTAAIRNEELGAPIDIEFLRDQSEPIPANDSLILIMLGFEVMILGFLFIAVVVFGEKREGSIRAYRISPSGLFNYVVSKTLVFTILSMVYGLVMVAVTLGFDVNYLRLAGLLVVSCALMTLLGLGIAVFFENLSQWFVPGVVLLGVNMLALIPYEIPAYNVPALRFLPGYNVIFGASEILFPTGKTDFMGPIMLRLGVGLAVAAVFAAWAVRRKMLKES